MKIEIPGSTVKAAKKQTMQRLDKEKHRTLTIMETQTRYAILFKRNKQGEERIYGNVLYKTKENMFKQFSNLSIRYPHHEWRWSLVNISFPEVEEL